MGFNNTRELIGDSIAGEFAVGISCGNLGNTTLQGDLLC